MPATHAAQSPPSDHELVRLAQGELPACSQSFEALVRRHEPRVRARSRRMLGCTAAAEDAAQEVFLSILTSLPRYAPERPFTHWLDVVTTNACLRALRQRARELPVQGARAPEEVAADWVAPDPLLRAALDRELAALPRATREALRLRFSEGHGFAEIARRLGLNESTVKMRLVRAREGLRRATGSVAPRPSPALNPPESVE